MRLNMTGWSSGCTGEVRNDTTAKSIPKKAQPTCSMSATVVDHMLSWFPTLTGGRNHGAAAGARNHGAAAGAGPMPRRREPRDGAHLDAVADRGGTTDGGTVRAARSP